MGNVIDFAAARARLRPGSPPYPGPRRVAVYFDPAAPVTIHAERVGPHVHAYVDSGGVKAFGFAMVPAEAVAVARKLVRAAEAAKGHVP
jgi:hypothetical protein